jgi:hypothetical protein
VDSGLSLLAYSPGRNKKKKPKVSMSAIAVERGWLARRKVLHVWRSTRMGIGLTRDGGGSCLL